MTLLSFSDEFEDSISEALFLKFSKVFEASSLYKFNKKIKEFETTHPNLSFVGFADLTRTVPITGKYMFSDESHRYSELLYAYKLHREIRCYEPHPVLAEWLAKIDEFAEYKREKKVIEALKR
jgi:hypothetical protein